MQLTVSLIAIQRCNSVHHIRPESKLAAIATRVEQAFRPAIKPARLRASAPRGTSATEAARVQPICAALKRCPTLNPTRLNPPTSLCTLKRCPALNPARPNSRSRLSATTESRALPIFLNYFRFAGLPLISAFRAASVAVFTTDVGAVPVCGRVGRPLCATSCMARSMGIRTAPPG